MNRIEIIEQLKLINSVPVIAFFIGFVYLLKCDDDDDDNSYYGKTFTSLKIRAISHQENAEKYKKDSKLMCSSTLLLVKNKPCTMQIMSMLPIYDDNDKIALLKEEEEFISENNCVNKYKKEETPEETESIFNEEDGENDYEDISETTNTPSIYIPIQIGCVYAIFDKYGTYIGSTMQPLPYRIKGHERDALKLLDQSSHLTRICSSYEIILRGNYDIKVLEWVAVESKKELRSKEREWIEKNNNCVNKNIPIRSQEEVDQYRRNYYQMHKHDPIFIEKMKKYMLNNKEKIRISHQRWNKENEEKIREYYKKRHQIQKQTNTRYLENRKKHKVKYNQSEKGRAANSAYNHRSEVKDHRKQMYQQKKETETDEHKQNRIKISKEWKSQVVECCGKKMKRSSLSEHKKTQLHIKNNPQ